MIKGIGCDIVEISRIEQNQAAFAAKILTASEITLYETLKNKQRKLEFLAGRFAAKEAIYKACNEMKLITNIEILNDENGKPVCLVDGYVIHISIAHEQAFAIAYAIWEE
ncbi:MULTISPECIES: holo-ACP synthase [Breznakia]|uniref:Holo-[acyl-carrier-protein] synthase n=1 Tax=Breznakia blatticola TaxID=1754012 RepID=A0A4R7ZI55_9FIRM|nr:MULTISPECIES: holo-ACP synthase [Breznakia]MDH6365878.1 holo-[acyl-carrier protein] synthase [Breznakia sp. PH1-1]MDH6403190.1 holo-[acyl-carrier protein] synthase [Breznakia sp. PF1-11]MDH6410899.1 holo-[acyl-carrier protein] synthase [Breznakia sp. PFB1-11]MDH6413044.1 holo-[acyl-carrier protein] synthase [Breznakia sp. PFB1-14]MDH6415412.1 holo-[acyl-carrier protein] synthase [Breznakia sp. PFB1-4]